MDATSGIARRATLALERTRTLDRHLDELAPDQPEWRQRAVHMRTLAAILGVDPASVVVTRDPVRSNHYPAYLITVDDHTADTPVTDTAAGHGANEPGQGKTRVSSAWRFVPDVAGGVYLILRACGGCGREIPSHVIASLVDLGRVLDGSGAEALTAVAARWDPGHDTGCPLYQPTDT